MTWSGVSGTIFDTTSSVRREDSYPMTYFFAAPGEGFHPGCRRAG
jgi:hypothetical protein